MRRYNYKFGSTEIFTASINFHMNRSINFLILPILALHIAGCATISDTTDPTLGKWNYELHHLPRGEPKGTLIIEPNGDGHKVTMKSPVNTFELIDAEIESGRLVSGYFKSEGYNIDVTGVFDGDSFEGQIDAEGNSFRMTAKRE